MNYHVFGTKKDGSESVVFRCINESCMNRGIKTAKEHGFVSLRLVPVEEIVNGRMIRETERMIVL